MKEKLGIISKYLFETSLGLYLFLTLIDLIQDNFVSKVFNINILLVIVIVGGIATLLLGYDEVTQLYSPAVDTSDRYYLLGLCALGSIIVYLKTKSLGEVSYIISIITFIIISIIANASLNDNTTKD